MRSAFLMALAVCCAIFPLTSASPASAQNHPASAAPRVTVQADGSVQVPPQSIPQSTFLSPAARAYVAQHLRDMQNPALLKQVNGVPGFMQPFLERDAQLFHVSRKEQRLAGVPVYDYLPSAGISPRNKHRILINLHGGGFSGCWPACAELESIPLAALMRIEVVTVNYREAPENTFPAASEDVAAVYSTLLKRYKPENVGIYGCSAGGALTAMSVAWFQTHHLPRPGAIGIFCASAGGFGGDSSYFALPMGEARMPAPPGAGGLAQLGYFRGANMQDPMIAPVHDPAILKNFPPTLLITGTRDFALSGALYTHEQLVNAGVDAELHVWEGLFHGFFYNADVPESQQAFHVMIDFFTRHLGAD